MANRKIVRPPAAAEYIALADSTLEKLRLRGDGPPFIRLTSRAIGYDLADLDRWLDGQREPRRASRKAHNTSRSTAPARSGGAA